MEVWNKLNASQKTEVIQFLFKCMHEGVSYAAKHYAPKTVAATFVFDSFGYDIYDLDDIVGAEEISKYDL